MSAILKRIDGDCLERIGIPGGGGYAVIERDLVVVPGDLVYCTRGVGAINTYIKQVRFVQEDAVVVGTAYSDPSRDFEFIAAEIRGVVTEVFAGPRWFRVYERSPAEAG